MSNSKSQMVNYEALETYKTNLVNDLHNISDSLNIVKSCFDDINNELWAGPNADAFRTSINQFFSQETMNWMENCTDNINKYIDTVLNQNKQTDTEVSKNLE